MGPLKSCFSLALLVAACCLTAWDPPAMAAPTASAEYDPIERVNRATFWFNDHLDTYLLVPVARGWDKVAPARVKQSVSNFFQNLRFPIVALNDLLQGKPLHAASDIGRFGVNTTVGLLGFFDPASGWGLERHNEDFGQTLGSWGIPAGPYLVLPFFGPSDARDTVGLAADSAGAVYPFFIAIQYSVSGNAADVVDERALTLKQGDEFKEASLDYYTAVRNAYLQRRKALIQDRNDMSQPEQQDLYTVDSDDGGPLR